MAHSPQWAPAMGAPLKNSNLLSAAASISYLSSAALENDQFGVLCLARTVGDDSAAQHRNRRGMAFGYRQDRMPLRLKAHIPDVQCAESGRGTRTPL